MEWMSSTVSGQQAVTGMPCLPTALSSTAPYTNRRALAEPWPPTAVLLPGQGRGGPSDLIWLLCRNRFHRPQGFSLDGQRPQLSSELGRQLILHNSFPHPSSGLGQSHHQKSRQQWLILPMEGRC